MKTIHVLGLMLCMAMVSISCSDDKNEPKNPETSTGSFSILHPDGTVLEDGDMLLVDNQFVDGSTPDDGNGMMKIDVHVRNNTDKALKLKVVGHDIISTQYDEVHKLATYCWNFCYDAPAPTPSDERELESNEVFKGFYTEIQSISEVTPSFDAVITYTIQNVENKETHTVKGHYIYTKK